MDWQVLIVGILSAFCASLGSWGAVRYEMGGYKATIGFHSETLRQHHDRLYELEKERRGES